MNYKISTYVLSALLAGVVIYSCGSSDKREDSKALLAQGDTSTVTPSTHFGYNVLTRELVDSLKGKKPSRDSSGSLVNSAVVRADLKVLQDSIGINCDFEKDPQVIYGFTFGMKAFNEFTKQLAVLDQQSGNKMMGVRVYLSLKTKKMKSDTQVYHDAFLVPLNAKGNDIYDIDRCKYGNKNALVNGDVVLNTSVPCPNQCQ
jgi:hypothetical protein